MHRGGRLGKELRFPLKKTFSMSRGGGDPWIPHQQERDNTSRNIAADYLALHEGWGGTGGRVVRVGSVKMGGRKMYLKKGGALIHSKA